MAWQGRGRRRSICLLPSVCFQSMPAKPLPFHPAPRPVQDVRSDPTLPRTRDVRCPACNHDEAVFFSTSTEEGMTLFFNCTSCGHRWRDYV